MQWKRQMTIIRSMACCKRQPWWIVFGFLNEGPVLPHTVGKPVSLASWPTFTPLRILATNHHCILSQGTSSLMESQLEMAPGPAGQERETRTCWELVHTFVKVLMMTTQGGPWAGSRVPAGPASASCKPLARLFSSCTSSPALRRSQANLARKAGMTHLLAFSLPRLHPGGCGVLSTLICTEVGGGRWMQWFHVCRVTASTEEWGH